MTYYQVIARESNPASDFGAGNVLAEFENAKHLGWAEYANDVGEAFFTISQGDPKLQALSDTELKRGVHIEIRRDSELVWGGWIGEVDETGEDIIFYCYSYEAALFWLHSDWNQTWTGEQIDTIITDLWARAQTGITFSALEWCSTGSIQSPTTLDGSGSPDIVLPEYSINYKRILFAMQELAALSIGETDNRVMFEITPAGQFNFWKDRGTNRTDTVLEYGGNVLGYTRVRTPMDRRNTILGVGSSPRDVVLRKTLNDPSGDISANSRRQEALFYSWIRDEDEMDRVNALRLARGKRTDDQIALSLKPGSVEPARTSGAAYKIGDHVRVFLRHGFTYLNGDLKMVTGQQVIYSRGTEYVRPIVQDTL